jgi:hypothetical protein
MLYHYSATWHREGSKVRWQAHVRHAGVLVGEPRGTIPFAPKMDADVSAAVNAEIEMAIENKVGVE